MSPAASGTGSTSCSNVPTVVVSYADRPSKYAYAGERNWLASKREVITMNEPHMAPWWFPANDHPTDKATFAFHVTVPSGLEAVANGVGTYFAQEGVFEFDRPDWGPQDIRIVASSIGSAGLMVGVALLAVEGALSAALQMRVLTAPAVIPDAWERTAAGEPVRMAPSAAVTTR